ncbi:hypothetical protein MPLSOD_340156 [Mesorhizobium sp. SOD10]|nr:hypothetical protein MPLSOD_340156 [Mesorhizobium sp. SOD10]
MMEAAPLDQTTILSAIAADVRFREAAKLIPTTDMRRKSGSRKHQPVCISWRFRTI